MSQGTAEQESSRSQFMSAGFWQGSTILLAEDDEVWRQLMGMALRDNGFNVIDAADGAQAVELYEKQGNGIDLILSDIMMPRLNGLELAEFNFDRRYLPFVICTAINDPFASLDALRCGVEDFLVKPSDERHIISVVVNALARRRFYAETKDDPALAGNLDRIIIDARLKDIPRAHAWLFAKLEPLRLQNREKRFIHAYYEFLMNAFEHGCLELGEAAKAECIAQDNYAGELERRERESRGKSIEISLSLLPDQVAVTIENHGAAFDYDRYLRITDAELHERLKRPNGRGIAIAARQFDSVMYGNGGSRVTLVKRLDSTAAPSSPSA